LFGELEKYVVYALPFDDYPNKRSRWPPHAQNDAVSQRAITLQKAGKNLRFFVHCDTRVNGAINWMSHSPRYHGAFAGDSFQPADNWTNVPYACFKGCNWIRSIKIQGQYSGKQRKSQGTGGNSLSMIAIPSQIEKLCSNCFASCQSLESISFESPSSLKRIESSAFAYSSLRLIIIPNQVEVLCSKCFTHCQCLESISFEIPSSLNCIESSAFAASSLRAIIIPNRVEILCSKCFAYCRSLESISFESPSSLQRIESSAFAFTSLHSITLPRNIELIDGSCFQDLTNASIALEPGNEHYCIDGLFLYDDLKKRLLRSFGDVRAVVISSSVEILGSHCFSRCTYLESISFESPSSLKRIESSAFAGSSLRSIIIPNRVEILCSKCFAFCRSLESISFESPSSLKCIESSAFASSSLHSIVLPRSVELIDGSCFKGLPSLSISFESGNDHYSIHGLLLYDYLRNRLLRSFGDVRNVVVLSSVEILGSHCFSGSIYLESISFESISSLKRIESSAFEFSSLRSIIITNRVEIIC
jgi:hypothetical protein